MFEKNEQKGLAYQMLVFDEVIKQGSFTAAAEVLGHTKSSISQYVSQLESVLDVKLLNRSTRKLNLTIAGEQLAKRSHQLFELLCLATEELKEHTANPSGRIAITAPHGFDAPLVTPLIADLCAEFPALVPELLFTDMRLDLLQNKLDMAISVGPQPDSNYHAILLGELDSILVASPKYLAASGQTTTDNFSTQSVITLPWQQQSVLKDLHGKQLSFNANKQIKVNTSSSAISSAVCGLGITLIPSIFVQNELNAGSLQRVLSDFECEKRSVYAIHPYQQQLPLALRLFVDRLKLAFKKVLKKPR